MTIDEAIKELETQKRTAYKLGYTKSAKAHQLGIEALKLFEGQRFHKELGLYSLLPGETK